MVRAQSINIILSRCSVGSVLISFTIAVMF